MKNNNRMYSFPEYKDVIDGLIENKSIAKLRLQEDYFEVCGNYWIVDKNIASDGVCKEGLTPNTLETYEEKSASISLIVTVSDNAGNIDQYDIPVSLEDNEWNISFSRHGGTCSIALIAEYADGSKDVLAKSNKLQLASSYWLENSEDMKANDSLNKI